MNQPFPEGATRRIDEHVLRREGEVLHVTVQGNLTGTNMTAFVAVYQQLLDEQGFLLILMDVRDSTGMDMAGRKVVTAWAGKHSTTLCSAIVGANVVIESTMNIFNRAVRVLSGKAPGLMFFSEEVAARTWLLAQIPRLRNRG